MLKNFRPARSSRAPSLLELQLLQRICRPPPCLFTRRSSSTSSPASKSESSQASASVPPKKKRGRPPLTSTTTTSSPFPLPPSPTAKHNSLPAFLHHAKATNLSPTSTVYKGTHYEYTVLLSLSRLGFTLHRVGGASDLGIDLLGTWLPPSLPLKHEGMKVVVQCKAEPPQPRHVRELEGAMGNAPLGWRGEGTVGFLVAKGEATRGVREAVRRAKGAMGFVFVERQGRVRQVLWNGRMGERLEGVGVGVKYDGEGEEVVLTWEGRVWTAGCKGG